MKFANQGCLILARNWKWVLLILAISNGTLFFFLSNISSFEKPTSLQYFPNGGFSHLNESILKKKSILVWNQAELIETAIFGLGTEPFLKNECEFTNCAIFDSEISLPLEEFDAIIFHMCLIWISELPAFQRKSHQRFIFFSAESPASITRSLPDIANMTNYFNWTMSYRYHSDIRLLYGSIEPKATAPKTKEEMSNMIKAMHLPSAKNFAAKKTRFVAWMASHCKTPGLRETYVRKLSKFIPIDIYGRCGNLTCPRNTIHSYSDPKCYNLMEMKYKFYLSFENSICEDYVTEKFFEIMKRKMIPIVYGGANYTKIAPIHSYIDAMQFTPKRLSQYLHLLDGNDKLYNEYFWWKDHYRVKVGVEQMARNGFCDLCKKLHQDQNETKYYSELITEWHPKTKCKHLNYSQTATHNY
jgi:alpha-1,3-fucosyltransferase